MSCFIPSMLVPCAKSYLLLFSSGLTSSAEFIPHHAFLRHVLTTCSPGRWLVSQILKLLIAYITLHYDIQPLKERPLNTVFGDTNIPSISATIRVRRRKSA